MNKKTYNTPNTEVTRIEIQHFIAASINGEGTQGSNMSDYETGGDAGTAMSDININDVWE